MRQLRAFEGARGGVVTRLLSWLVVIAALVLFVALSERGLKAPARPDALTPAAAVPAIAVATDAGAEKFVVETDAGPVDVTAALARIKAGARLPFQHDGTVFQNREGRLPRKPEGYYHEYVLPTPGQGGPGARRIIQGADGQFYLSVDHYGSFLLLE